MILRGFPPGTGPALSYVSSPTGAVIGTPDDLVSEISVNLDTTSGLTLAPVGVTYVSID